MDFRMKAFLAIARLLVSFALVFLVAGSCAAQGLSSNSTCTIKVTFTPTKTGARSGSVTVTDNATNSPESLPPGTGT
ncbi:MAG: hypothetical protein DMG79_13680 [Acidobacteria bacterium]|nr:MAG: hypothetical protein DMG79_13680 [Acidobacteriota bacterium]